MKRQIILAIMFMVGVVCSCGKYEGSLKEPSFGNDVISAAMEGTDDTRAKLNDKYEVVWSENDKVSIVGSKSATFTLSSGADTKFGTFAGNLSDAGTGPYFAVMPYDTDASASAEGVTFTIPQKKGAQKNNIAGSLNPMAGKVYGDKVGFRNLFGLLKLTLTSEDSVRIKKIALHDLGGNMLWGECFVPVKADTLDYKDIRLSGGDNTITMVWNSSPIICSEAKSYIFAVPPGSLDRGFSLVFYEDDNGSVGRTYTFVQKVYGPISAERSVLLALTVPTLTAVPEAKDVKKRGYYKTLFIDAGCRLSNYYSTSHFKWLTTLELADDYEYFAGDSTSTNVSRQAYVLNKNNYDSNGVLLYPDGEPRFRMVYCNGGKSSYHAQSLFEGGRHRFHDFYFNGGSYVGTCAGGFLARTLHEGINVFENPDTTKNHGFGIWPGTLTSSAMPISNSKYPTIYTAQKILTKFGPFAEGDTIEQVRHHGGFFVADNATNRAVPHESLMSYQYTEQNTSSQTSYTEYNRLNYDGFGKKASRVNEVSMIAYKKSETTGRAILCGSHPERETSGKKLALMENMVTYALDGIGELQTKAEMTLGKTYTATVGVGDRQYHHFTFSAASDIKDFTLTLDSSYPDDLCLTLRKGDYAWLSDADYLLQTSADIKSLNIKNLPAGKWYIGVYCPTTVTTTVKTGSNYLAYFQYSGNTHVLNGVPYSLTASQK